MLKLTRKLKHIWSSFWFVPVFCVLSAIGAAETLVLLDRQLQASGAQWWQSTALSFGIDGSRGLLSAIGGGTFGAAATAFSITVSVIVTASTSYGPRLVGNFMSDRRNQWTLGLLVSTFVYTILVSRWLRSNLEDGTSFVPRVAVLVALILAIVNVFLLISFIHHMASSTRVSAITVTVSDQLRRVVENVYRFAPARTAQLAAPVGGRIVVAKSSGYVARIDLLGIVRNANAADGWVALEAAVGDHVLAGMPVARVGAADAERLAATLPADIDIARDRETAHDVRFAQQQLAEVAVRALSPGTNDPYTAVAAIHELAAGHAELVTRPALDSAVLDDDGTPRVYWRPPRQRELLDDLFNQLMPYIGEDHNVYCALAQLALGVESANYHAHLVGHADEYVAELRTRAERNSMHRTVAALDELTRRAEHHRRLAVAAAEQEEAHG
ncbi:DUF2254 domain-containing protein [Tessaracoccus sp. OH4464_COT-324]|uniref:DUF2254 domain-containing protein n=1 Tax=Tessaracoccus sp. OH4464_COT-324 TaxID=2491059 RepID=UPI000F63F652|nr:DUF2254 domain-containing protein [Tessaracoccus sp. OH4464_COT-324]RRD46880.1 DUF2254 domain-containing protein [Tessaracoccus sp. OH4464_COT-324]